jgi:hypothetical protein
MMTIIWKPYWPTGRWREQNEHKRRSCQSNLMVIKVHDAFLFRSKEISCLDCIAIYCLCMPIIQVDRPTWILSNSWEHDKSCLNLIFYIVFRYIISKVLEFKLKYNYWFEFKHDSSCSQEHERIQIHSMHIDCLKKFSLFIRESSSTCVD